LAAYVQALNFSASEDFCSFDNYCSKSSQSRTKSLYHETSLVADNTACLGSQDGAIRAPATDLKVSFKSEVIPASEDYLTGNPKSTNTNGPGSFPAILPLAREEHSSDDEENYKQHAGQIHARASRDETAPNASNTIFKDDASLRTPADNTCVHIKTVSEDSVEDSSSKRLDVADWSRDGEYADVSKDYETSTSRDLKGLPYEDRARRNSYLGGIGSWTRARSSSPNKLLAKDTSGNNRQSPLLELAGPTTSTQHGSHPGSGSNQNPTRTLQDIRFEDSGNQQSNGKQQGRKRLPADNDDGEDDGPTQSGTPEAAKENRVSQGKVFACPFHKNDPAYYRTSLQNDEKYIKCAAGLGWNISGLKWVSFQDFSQETVH
jgi:hypothetical protein